MPAVRPTTYKVDVKHARNLKHRHGTANPILQLEEHAILAAVDRAIASVPNAQTIGRNGELPLRDFLNRYLPYTFRAVTGHFVTPAGTLSPQLDVMILDARYPLLAQNVDGSVLAMLHSVLKTVELKTRLTKQDIAKAWLNARQVMQLASEVAGYGNPRTWRSVTTDVLSYRAGSSLERLFDQYGSSGTPIVAGLDVYMMRLPTKDQPVGKTLGVMFHFEPRAKVKRPRTDHDFFPLDTRSWTVLSDFYYRLVQNSYYVLQARRHSLGDIGAHVMSYMSWSTYLDDET